MQITPPAFRSLRFNCPHCLAYAHMNWQRLRNDRGSTPVYQAICPCCNSFSLWVGSNYDLELDDYSDAAIAYPQSCSVPPASPDMPASIAADFEEARQVFSVSPRASAALLRLCIQKLCEHLLQEQGDINKQINKLVQNGLPKRIQQALDTVRVIGNHAVHPGVMSLEDRPELVAPLFGIVNLIVENQITTHTLIDELFNGLPAGAREAIEKRDTPKS